MLYLANPYAGACEFDIGDAQDGYGPYHAEQTCARIKGKAGISIVNDKQLVEHI